MDMDMDMDMGMDMDMIMHMDMDIDMHMIIHMDIRMDMDMGMDLTCGRCPPNYLPTYPFCDIGSPHSRLRAVTVATQRTGHRTSQSQQRRV